MNECELNENIQQYPIRQQNLEKVQLDEVEELTHIQIQHEFVNRYFDKIYCINLEKKLYKWEETRNRLLKHGICASRFEAIDGTLYSGQSELATGEFGCLSSHLEIIKDAKKNSYGKILIFEDDVHLSDDFLKRIIHIQDVSWKLLYLGASQYDWSKTYYLKNFYLSKNTLGTFAYAVNAVNSNIYGDLIEEFSKKDYPVDKILTKIQEKYYGECYTMFPNIVIADVRTSDIREPRDIQDHSHTMKWDLSNFSTIFSENKNEIVESSESIFCDSYLKNKVTLLIKSFMRKDCVINQIQSIRKKYKTIDIVVVDDSNPPLNFDIDDNIKTYNIEFDSGLAAGRNYGVSKINTPYFVLLDDDFEFTENTKIERFYEVISSTGLDILGGQVFDNEKINNYFGNFEVDEENKLIWMRRQYTDMGSYKKCQIVLNFFIANTNKIKQFGWDNELKLAEHSAFFFTHREKLNVGFIDDVIILHKSIKDANYSKYRNRAASFFSTWMEKVNLNYYANFETKIVVNPKLEKKKFDHTLALKNLTDLDKLFRSLGILYWLQDGTLLGLVREKKFIEHDMDSDIGIMFKDFPPSALKKIESIGFQVTNTFGYPKNSLEISLRRFGIKTDIFFYYKESDYVYHSAFTNKKTGQYNSRIDYKYQPFNLKEVEFLGKSFFVPSNEMYFIETKYGKSWKTPIQRWDWAYGPANHHDTGIVFNSTEKDIQINEWSLTDDKNYKKRIITYGTFDTFHYGHLELLKKAKQLGDYLVVGLSTDEFNELKGKRSKFSYERRYNWLKSISFIDEIIPETNWEQKENDIKDRNIDVMIMGDDWVGKFDYLPCRVVYVQRTPEISSTKIKSITQ